MRTPLIAAMLASLSVAAHEAHIPVGGAALYARDVGRGQPIIVLHGGPDFDHRYFLPDLDRFADAYRLIYYDQRGRGLSAAGVKPEDVTLASDLADLDKVRQHYRFDSVTLLGHSWGTVLALEYALRHPDRVSHLILMNPAPASHRDYVEFRSDRVAKLGPELDKMMAIRATPEFKRGDPDTVAAYYRIHFKQALVRPEHLDAVIRSLRASFTNDGVLKARAVEDRLMADTWSAENYDLLPKLATLKIPTLVLYSEGDFIPLPTAEHIAKALPNATMVTLKNCGHFSYLECPAETRAPIDAFLRGAPARR